MVKESGTNSFLAEYYIKDLSGNVRVSFSDTDMDGKPEVLQENHYYPFGMTFSGLNTTQVGALNPWQFNGKEVETGNNLLWSDFGARHYDSQLGRWHVPDPASQHKNPYMALRNDPVNRIDPDGRKDIFNPRIRDWALAFQQEKAARDAAWHSWISSFGGGDVIETSGGTGDAATSPTNTQASSPVAGDKKMRVSMTKRRKNRKIRLLNNLRVIQEMNSAIIVLIKRSGRSFQRRMRHMFQIKILRKKVKSLCMTATVL